MSKDMKKILSLSIVSLILASILLGVIPSAIISVPLPPAGQGVKVIPLGTLSTNNGNFFTILVVINASSINTAGYSAANFGSAVANTLSSTQITLTITDTNGNPITTTSPNPVTIQFTTSTLVGYFYNDSTNPRNKLIFFLIFLNSNNPTSTLTNNGPVLSALGLPPSATVYDENGNQITLATALSGAGAGQMQVVGNGLLSSTPIWMNYLSNPNNIVNSGYELYAKVNTQVRDASGNVVATLSSLNTLILAPFVFYIFNPVNGQQAGVGRSLLNVTAIIGYALAAGQNPTDVLFQLTFSAPNVLIPFLQFANVTSLSPSQLTSGSQTTIFGGTGYIGPALPVYAQDGITSGLYPISGFYLPSTIKIGANTYTLQTTTSLTNDLSTSVAGPAINNPAAGIYILLVNSQSVGSSQTMTITLVTDTSVTSPYISTAPGTTLTISGVGSYKYLVVQYSGAAGTIYIAFPIKLISTLPSGNIRLSLTAVAYERIVMTQVGGNYTGFLMTTPNTPLSITGQAQGSYIETLAQSGTFFTLTATVGIGPFTSSYSMKILTNSTTIHYNNFSIIGLTPKLPNLNGVVATVYQEAVRLEVDPNLLGPLSLLVIAPSAMQFSGTTLSEITFASASNPILIAATPSQLPYTVNNANYPITFTLYVPSPLSYVALVQLGLWSLTTVVQVKAYWLGTHISAPPYSYNGGNVEAAINTQSFKAIISPPSPSQPNVPNILSLLCGSSPATFYFTSPDDVLYPASVTGSYNPSVVTVTFNPTTPLLPSSLQAVDITTPGPGSNDVTSINTFLQGTAVPFSGITVKVISGNNVIASASTSPASPPVYPDPFSFRYSFQLSVALGTTTSISIKPSNVISVAISPSQIANAKIQITFTTSDYAVYYDFPNQVNATITIQLPPATAQLLMPPVTSLASPYVNITYYEPYLSQPLTVILMNVLATNQVQLALVTGAGNIPVGNLTKITVILPGNVVKVIPLNSTNIQALFGNAGLEWQETSACTAQYRTYLNIEQLASILGLPSISALNGSILNVTVYDTISGKYVWNITKLLISGAKVNALSNVTVFHVLTARYIGAIEGVPVEIAYQVVQQPFINITVPDLAGYSASSLQVARIDIYGQQYPSGSPYTVSLVINATASNVKVYINNALTQTVPINAIPSISGTYGLFVGTPVTFSVEPGNINAPFGKLYVNIANASILLGNSSYFVRAPIQSINGTTVLATFMSKVVMTMKDSITGLTFNVTLYIKPVQIAPIRLSIVGEPIPITASDAQRVFYFYNKSIVLTTVGTTQYINLQLLSTIDYPFPFYIMTIVYPGKNVNPSSSKPLLVNFQTVVPSPVLPANTVVQVPVQLAGTTPLTVGYYTVVFVAVPYASVLAPPISDFPAFLVVTNVQVVQPS
ncbi:MAG: hypothetical protein QXL33_03380 [Sulfolobaceae archaeon]